MGVLIVGGGLHQRLGCRTQRRQVDLLLRLAVQLVELIQILRDRVGEVGELERQHFRIGHARHRHGVELRQRPAVDELRVAVAPVPVERIVDRVIDARAVAAE